MNQNLVEERIAELKRIAERAFNARFSRIEIVQIDVKPGYDHDGDPVVDVNFVCDGDYNQLTGKALNKLHSEIVSKAWRNPEHGLGLGFPLFHYSKKKTAKSATQPRRRAAVNSGLSS